MKEAWTKQEFNLNSAITPRNKQQLSGLKDNFFLLFTTFIKEIEKVLPSQATNFSTTGVSGKVLSIKKAPSLPIDDMLNSYEILISTLNHIHPQEMVEKLGNSLVSKMVGVSDAYKPREHTIKMASQMRTPLYVNNLVIVQLQSFLKQFSSISTQMLQTIATIQTETEIITHRTILELLSCVELSLKNIKRILSSIATSVHLGELSTKKEDSTLHLQENNINIWAYFKKNQNKSEVAKISSLNGLILKLTSTSDMDPSFMKNFFLTYRSFTTPDELFYKLMERYNVPDEFSSEKAQIQMRVCVALKYWLSVNIRDFGHGVRFFLSILNVKIKFLFSYSKVWLLLLKKH